MALALEPAGLLADFVAPSPTSVERRVGNDAAVKGCFRQQSKGVQQIPADGAQMREHRLLGRLRVAAQEGSNDRRVFVAIIRAALGAEGGPLNPEPLFLIAD